MSSPSESALTGGHPAEGHVPTAVTEHAEGWARAVLAGLRTTYPYATQHVSSSPDDCSCVPDQLHPIFHGCFDWHSSVHMHWSLVRLLELAPAELAENDTDADAVALLSERFTPEHVAVEADYLRDHPHYERPYGWAWTAMLVAAVSESQRPEAAGWASALAPLADVVADHLLDWLPRLVYPVRHGVHTNTAFALALVDEAYTILGREDVRTAVAAHAGTWFGADTDADTRTEPSGNDFLSPTLAEAELMRRVLPATDFGSWLEAYLPGLGTDASMRLLAVPEVRDPTDGQLVHLYGLGLSRAWVLRNLARTLDAPRAEALRTSATAQAAAATEQITAGDFMSTHWLVSFALLAALADR